MTKEPIHSLDVLTGDPDRSFSGDIRRANELSQTITQAKSIADYNERTLVLTVLLEPGISEEAENMIRGVIQKEREGYGKDATITDEIVPVQDLGSHVITAINRPDIPQTNFIYIPRLNTSRADLEEQLESLARSNRANVREVRQY